MSAKDRSPSAWSKILSKQNVLAACVFVDLFAVSLVVPLLPIRYKELGFTPVLIGTLGSIYSFTQIFGGIAYGIVSDRLEDRRIVLLVSFAGAAISYGMVSFPECVVKCPSSHTYLGQYLHSALMYFYEFLE